MLMNVIDLRERPYRWKNVLAVVESASKNNSAKDADKIETAAGIEIDYAERDDLNVRDAVLWAEGLQGRVTLYIYDRDAECRTASTA
ncbi:MAG: hypothetical protein LJE62_10525 [Silicimonas sp.]|nr:hypothetical protein [Silicimonas sp.]